MWDLIAFFILNLLAVMSPGPDFAIVAKTAFSGHRKSAILASVGIACALLIHVTYCLLGVAVFLKHSPLLFKTIQTLGALYLG